ncbi:SPI-2 type III secretion system translocon protein SseD [Salmonella enterica]|uniref:Type III secretion system translocon protein SseD n=3 Tax=Salmonella enterica TaxID=28901 RepID=A0A344SQE1_SALER|nr:type III secretion system translocon protein SseD [Salmonella enterica]ECC1642476.1 SPI-2 type III secretion system translocon protein SseD [Salmonella enterica subsp. houtenae]EDS0025379.1 SPI-2 type III secretion system translocon protein SseD [Salmonella enterica subsp. enterica serovar Carswell]EHG4291351.1 SPI-2 type III secretion system translocon protein SseD [Salmonella enterica subsp. houtenae serovar 48:g,z51:-]MBA2161796.1 SPI-2 type III secretion system translocon protein SseD [S
MDASNAVSILSPSSLSASSTTSQSQFGEKVNSDSLLLLFDEIWMKLLELAKKLRDILRSYNEVRQELSWELQKNALQTQMDAIDKTYSASMLNAGGSIFSGLLTIGCGIMGGESGLMLGHGAGNIFAGSFSLGASVEQYQSDQDRAIAELKQTGAQSYSKNMMDIMDKALEIMQQILGMGTSLVEVLAQMLRSLAR